ncbi:MAG: hypothetical protein ACREPU_07905 [Rhodanobacteraceae bacterium]
MNTFSHFLRRHYEQWRSDAITQGEFRPRLSILEMSAMSVIIGTFCAMLAWVLYRLIGPITHAAFVGRWNFASVSPASLYPRQLDSFNGNSGSRSGT